MNKLSSHLFTAVSAYLLTGGLSVGAANSLLLDFGPTTVTPEDSTTSPAFVSGAISGVVTPIWDQIGPGPDQSAQPDVDANLLFANGAEATGVAVNLGMSSTSAVGFTVVDFDTQPNRSNVLGTDASSGVYAGTSVAKDGIFSATNNQVAIGLQITGLAAGLYDVFVTAANTNQRRPQNVYLAAAAPGSSIDFSQLTALRITNMTLDTFVEGDNYARFSGVQLLPGQAFFVVTENYEGAAQGQRGFLNSVEFILIPEPASVSSLLIGAGTLLGFVRARRRSSQI